MAAVQKLNPQDSNNIILTDTSTGDINIQNVISKKINCQLKKPNIVIPLRSSSKAEAGDEYDETNLTNISQQKVFGLLVPLIVINNTIIDYDCIKSFSLSSESVLPELSLTVIDKSNFLTNIDKPNIDSEVRVIILPPKDNTYERIDLTFYINNISITNNVVSLTGSYKLPALTSSRFEAYGQMSTYNLLEHVARSTGLGFKSSVENSNDSRYIYADNKSYLNLMANEIAYSNTDNGAIYDYWVDFSNNINFTNIKERCLTVDSEDNLGIWSNRNISNTLVDEDQNVVKTVAVISNIPSLGNTDVFVRKYSAVLSPGSSISSGIDRICSIYEEHNEEYMDYLLHNGDASPTNTVKYDYLGETYSNYNYILAKAKREEYFKKLNIDKIKVTLDYPNLGLCRGNKVIFIRYNFDGYLHSKLEVAEKNNVIKRTGVNSNIILDDFEIKPEQEDVIYDLDRTVSAQYYINSVNILFNNNKWKYVLTLVKDASYNVSIINASEE